MKISDLLRTLADTLDAEQAVEQPAAPVIAEPVMEPVEGELDQQPDDIFVPPLQLKMELLKKAVDVESIYDECEGEEVERHSYPNMMSQIRRNAGLNPAVVSELTDDEPLER